MLFLKDTVADMQKIKLKLLGIVIHKELAGKAISISSDMKRVSSEENDDFNAAVDSLESIILSQFKSGVDVEEKSYVDGLKSTYDKLVYETNKNNDLHSKLFNNKPNKLVDKNDEDTSLKENRLSRAFYKSVINEVNEEFDS